jgi:hypothetical protein
MLAAVEQQHECGILIGTADHTLQSRLQYHMTGRLHPNQRAQSRAQFHLNSSRG